MVGGPLHELGVEYTEPVAQLALRISSRVWRAVGCGRCTRAPGPFGSGRGSATSRAKDQSVVCRTRGFGGLRWGLGARGWALRAGIRAPCVWVCVCFAFECVSFFTFACVAFCVCKACAGFARSCNLPCGSGAAGEVQQRVVVGRSSCATFLAVCTVGTQVNAL